MTNFGFSAFLRLVCSNDRRQRSGIKSRMLRRGGGYDFHRSLRLICRRFTSGEISLSEGLSIADQITKIPERRSARSGLQAYASWSGRDELMPPFKPAQFESPAGRFKVTFSPDFCQRIDGRLTAAHLWNTKTPSLDSRQVCLALHLIADAYAGQDATPQDIAVLDLPGRNLFKLSDGTASIETAHALALRLDNLFVDLEQEIRDGAARPEDPPRPPM